MAQQQLEGRVMEFLFGECPLCEFSVVMPLVIISGEPELWCPFCLVFNAREVRMTHRLAKDDDRPVGHDGRKEFQVRPR